MASKKHKKWCVYIHTCKINNKSYIGITCKPPNHRWGKDGSQYLNKYKNGAYKHPVFARALKKYLNWNDDWEHIIFADNLLEQEAKHMERLLIALYRTNVCRYGPDYGYNCTDGGDGSYGYKHTDEAKQKVGQIHKGKRISDEQIARIIELQSIPIVQFDLNNNYLGEYDSAVEAGKLLGIDASNIRKCICGRSFTAGGFLWMDKVDYQNGMLPQKLPHGQRYRHGVRQYLPNGELVMVYETMAEAERRTGIKRQLIRRACIKDIKSAGGYLWISQQDYDNGQRITILPKVHRNNIPVVQTTMSGEFIAEYSSIAMAKNATGVDANTICQCCKGNLKHAGGFYWWYKEEYDKKDTTQND